MGGLPTKASQSLCRRPVGVTGELGAQLVDPLLAELLVVETVGADRGGAAALGLLAEVMESRVPRAARVAWRWLRAVALERIGDIEEAERELLAAESMDPDWPLPLIDLARIASDRGDVERGLGLLRRAGAGPDHPLVELVAGASGRAAPRSRPQRAVLVRVRPQVQEMPSGPRTAGAGRAGELVVREGRSACRVQRLARTAGRGGLRTIPTYARPRRGAGRGNG